MSTHERVADTESSAYSIPNPSYSEPGSAGSIPSKDNVTAEGGGGSHVRSERSDAGTRPAGALEYSQFRNTDPKPRVSTRSTSSSRGGPVRMRVEPWKSPFLEHHEKAAYPRNAHDVRLAIDRRFHTVVIPVPVENVIGNGLCVVPVLCSYPQTPGPGDYSPLRIPYKGTVRMAPGHSKSDVDWEILRASQLPGPGEYSPLPPAPAPGGKFSTAFPKSYVRAVSRVDIR
jgi:hypothetical protein